MPTPQSSTTTGATTASNADLRADPAEDRTFPTEGAEALAGEGPAELLMDDVTSRAGQGDGAQAAGTAGIDTGPLKSAANDLAVAVSDVLKGKAGSAQQMAKDAYDQIKGRTAEPLSRADGFVRQKPYAALGIAVVAGMLLAGFRRRR